MKVRAWHSVNKVMYDPKDVPVLLKNFQDDSVWKYMLSSGVEDIAGKEIFAGDVIIAANDSIQIIEFGEWAHLEDESELYGIGFSFSGKEPFSKSNHRPYEIIGNIYQNPDLAALTGEYGKHLRKEVAHGK